MTEIGTTIVREEAEFIPARMEKFNILNMHMNVKLQSGFISKGPN